MVDFQVAGPRSLWKSGPLFSTGTKEAELMLDEPELNPHRPEAQFADWRSTGWAAIKRRPVDPNLSTAFAERRGMASTGWWGTKEAMA